MTDDAPKKKGRGGPRAPSKLTIVVTEDGLVAYVGGGAAHLNEVLRVYQRHPGASIMTDVPMNTDLLG